MLPGDYNSPTLYNGKNPTKLFYSFSIFVLNSLQFLTKFLTKKSFNCHLKGRYSSRMEKNSWGRFVDKSFLSLLEADPALHVSGETAEEL